MMCHLCRLRHSDTPPPLPARTRARAADGVPEGRGPGRWQAEDCGRMYVRGYAPLLAPLATNATQLVTDISSSALVDACGVPFPDSTALRAIPSRWQPPRCPLPNCLCRRCDHGLVRPRWYGPWPFGPLPAFASASYARPA